MIRPSATSCVITSTCSWFDLNFRKSVCSGRRRPSFSRKGAESVLHRLSKGFPRQEVRQIGLYAENSFDYPLFQNGGDGGPSPNRENKVLFERLVDYVQLQAFGLYREILHHAVGHLVVSAGSSLEVILTRLEFP